MDYKLVKTRIDSQTFVAVLWSGVVISLSFLAFRIFVRIKSFRMIYADDVLVLTAWLMFFVSSVIWQTQQMALSQQMALYEEFGSGSGTFVPTPEQLEAGKTLQTLLRCDVVITILYLTALWTVKLSFLIFFRRLSQKVQGQNMWWCVTGLTVVTWVTCVGITPFKCFLGSLERVFAECATPSELEYQWISVIYPCIVDVITDAAIIMIPILMLWNVSISWKKKLALMSLFSLTIIVIVISIVRVAVGISKKSSADMGWIHLWNNIEVSVSIVVSCLASFRQLYVKSEQSAFARKRDNVTFWGSRHLSAFTSSIKWSASSRDHSLFPRNTRHHAAIPIQDSTECMVPLEIVHVSHDTGKSSNIAEA